MSKLPLHILNREGLETALTTAWNALDIIVWTGTGDSCIDCGNPHEDGHQADCDVGAALFDRDTLLLIYRAGEPR